jgi:hypothetical protein
MDGNPPSELFNLTIMPDNPMFEGFGLVDEPSKLGRNSLREDMSPGFGASGLGREFKPARLSKLWTRPKVKGRVAPFQDFPGISLVLPAFSARACDALRSVLELNGELLPLESEVGEYYFYNITTFSNALDTDRSEGSWCPRPTRAMSFTYFEFDRKKLSGLSIFRIYECPVMTIVTDGFVRMVYEAGLNGFRFRKIWPLPPGTNWQLEAKKKDQKQRTITQKLKKQTLVVILPLNAKKPSAVQKKKIKRLEDELDAQLVVTGLDAPYFGSYEGSDTVDNEFRIFISCPDVEALVRKLSLWLNSLNWEAPVHLMKRFGEMRDADAREELIAIESRNS